MLELGVFNATFNNISVKFRQSVLLVGRGELRENHRSTTSHWQPLSHSQQIWWALILDHQMMFFFHLFCNNWHRSETLSKCLGESWTHHFYLGLPILYKECFCGTSDLLLGTPQDCILQGSLTNTQIISVSDPSDTEGHRCHDRMVICFKSICNPAWK
jgi:hypothetical protein